MSHSQFLRTSFVFHNTHSLVFPPSDMVTFGWRHGCLLTPSCSFCVMLPPLLAKLCVLLYQLIDTIVSPFPLVNVFPPCFLCMLPVLRLSFSPLQSLFPALTPRIFDFPSAPPPSSCRMIRFFSDRLPHRLLRPFPNPLFVDPSLVYPRYMIYRS